MAAGCRNSKAVNYNPAATADDGSCVFLTKHLGVCYAFEDIDPDLLNDKSFTLSFSIEKMDWVFFHDYTPDFYFSGRDQLYNLKDNKIYIHNQGAPGLYHSGATKSFFIDAVFADAEMLLDSVQWITEVFAGDTQQQFSTLSHITVWNRDQCSGRIATASIFKDLKFEVRETQSIWSFNDFRNMVASYGAPFLKNIFNNFDVDSAALNGSKPWYDQNVMQGSWFMIRFEFDNTSGNQLVFHSAEISATKSYR